MQFKWINNCIHIQFHQNPQKSNCIEQSKLHIIIIIVLVNKNVRTFEDVRNDNNE